MDPYIKHQLQSIKADLLIYRNMLKETALDIMRQGFSDYPVFVAHQYEVNLGEVILDRKELGTGWTIQATTLEELVEKKVVEKDKVSLFRDNYKDASEYACIFMITEKGGHFIFYPYKGEQSNTPDLSPNGK